MDEPKTRPDNPPRYGGAEVPAEAAQFMDDARAELKRAGFDLDAYAAGRLSVVVSDVMRGRPVSRDIAARAYAVYLATQEIGLEPGAWSTGKDVDPTAALIAQPAPAADTSGYRLAGYVGPLVTLQSPCACGSTHTVAVPARRGDAL